MPHAILHVIAENPKHPHIGDKVEQTAVHKNGSKNGQEARHVQPVLRLLGHEPDRHKAEALDKTFEVRPQSHLKQKDSRIENDQSDIHKGKIPGRDVIS